MKWGEWWARNGREGPEIGRGAHIEALGWEGMQEALGRATGRRRGGVTQGERA